MSGAIVPLKYEHSIPAYEYKDDPARAYIKAREIAARKLAEHVIAHAKEEQLLDHFKNEQRVIWTVNILSVKSGERMTTVNLPSLRPHSGRFADDDLWDDPSYESVSDLVSGPYDQPSYTKPRTTQVLKERSSEGEVKAAKNVGRREGIHEAVQIVQAALRDLDSDFSDIDAVLTALKRRLGALADSKVAA